VAPLDRGIAVQRRFADAGGPISTARVGDVFSVTVTIVAPTDLYHLQVEAPIPAGVEALDPNLPTGFQYDPMGQPILQPVDAAAGGWWNWTPPHRLPRRQGGALCDLPARGHLRLHLPGAGHAARRVPRPAARMGR
jgi:hypothetical protein